MDDELDGDERRVTEISEEVLQRLLELASESRDLVARSALRWDDEDPIWSDLGDAFRQRVLDDLAARDDLSLSDCVGVIENLVDPDDLDEDDYVLGRELSVALVRASLRNGGLETRWARRVSWDDVDPNDLHRLLAASSERLMTAALVGDESRGEIEFWVRHVAPRAMKAPVERLEWLRMQVARRADEGYIGDTLDFVGDLVWRWFGEIPRSDLRGEMRGLYAVAAIARCGALDQSGDIEFNLREAWDSVRWDGLSNDALATLLSEETPAAVAGAAAHDPREEALLPLVRDAAKIVHPEVADRLVWFAESVGKPAGAGPAFREGINHGLTEVVCEWLTELERADVEDIVLVLRAFRRVPMGASVIQRDVDESLEALRDVLRKTVDDEADA
jgi:hypothetical protein